MQLINPSPAVAPFGMRAIAMVARAAAGGLTDVHRTLCDTIQRLFLHTDLDVDALPEITPAELAEHFGDPAAARQLVRAMIVASLATGPATPEQVERVAGFAAALGVDEPAVRVIEHLAHEHRLRFMLDLHRRSNLRDYINNQYRTQGGIVAVARALLEFKGWLHDPGLAARFRSLAELPEDTLGRGLFTHYEIGGFSVPGEEGGFPIGALFHDLGHVLAGYDTTAEGELQIAAFQAGYRRTEDSFFTVLFAVLIHTAGVNVSPIPMPVKLGRIGDGDLAARMIHALRRGSQMTTDLGAEWDFGPYLPLPLAEARRRLGVPPIDAAYATGPGVYGPPIGRW